MISIRSGSAARVRDAVPLFRRRPFIAVPIVLALCAASSPLLTAETPRISGLAESTVEASFGGDGGTAAVFEEYANIRLESSIGEYGKFFASMNALAAGGTEAPLDTDCDLERLYLSLRLDSLDASAGLMRIPFGYSSAFRPTDILNPVNPLYPDARLTGVLGGIVSWYPADEISIAVFVADRAATDIILEDPVAGLPLQDARPLAGLSFESHASRFSVQGLYAAREPVSGSDAVESRAGLSLKIEAGVGLVFEALFFSDGQSSPALHGSGSWLKASGGVDYSFLDGKLVLLAQYLYNGSGPLSSDDTLEDLYGDPDWHDGGNRVPLTGFADYYRRQYAWFSALCSKDDFTRFQAAVLVSLDDGSLVPVLEAEHEPFQGLVVTLSARAYLDERSFGGGEYGELGREQAGRAGEISLRAAVRF